MLNTKLASEMLAYLIKKAGGTMYFVYLMELMYLIDREYLLRYEKRFTGDHYLNYGSSPALAKTTNGIGFGDVPELMTHIRVIPGTAELTLLNPNLSESELKQLTPEIKAFLDEGFEKFYAFVVDPQIRPKDFRSAFPEMPKPAWPTPLSVSYRKVLVSYGKTPEQAERILQEIRREEREQVPDPEYDVDLIE